MPPHEKTSFRAQPAPISWVVDHVGGHTNEREMLPVLADELVASSMRDQVAEPLKRHSVAVVHELGHCLPKRRNLNHALFR